MSSLLKLKCFSDIKHFIPKPLTIQQTTSLSRRLNHFKTQPNKLHLEYRFDTPEYDVVVQKMNLIGRIADKMDHHPDWTLFKNKLEINLNTHDIKDISQKDYVLAYISQNILFEDKQAQLLKKWNNIE